MNIVKTLTKPVSMYVNLPFFEQLCSYVTSGDFAPPMNKINLVSILCKIFLGLFLPNLAYKEQILLVLQNCSGDDNKHKLELCKKKHLPVDNCTSVQQTVKTYHKTGCIFKYWNGLAAYVSLPVAYSQTVAYRVESILTGYIA